MIKKQLVFQSKLVCRTGLHLGNELGQVSPRGLDAPVLQHPIFQQGGKFAPYISATALKGKLRNIAEVMLDGNELNKDFHTIELDEKVEIKLRRHECDSSSQAADCPVCFLFGTGSDGEKDRFKPRLVFRNALYNDEKLNDKKKLENEIKIENTIGRLVGEANPRTMERAPIDTTFDFKTIYLVYQGEEAKAVASLNNFIVCLRFLQDYYVGGNGSRGSGKIEFKDIKFQKRDFDKLEDLQKELERIIAEEVTHD